MLRKKRGATRPRDIGAWLVIACAFFAIETVLRAGIDVNFDLGPLGADGFDIAKRNAGVLFAEMQLRRHFWLIVGEAGDGAAIKADRRRQPRQFGRSRIGHAAAET